MSCLPEQYLTLKQISEKTCVPYTTLRKWVKLLGIEPDLITKRPNGVLCYSYGASAIRRLYEHVQSRAISHEPYMTCHWCHSKVSPNTLTSGLCPLCYARKMVDNYCCHGDYYKNDFDSSRVDILLEAIRIVVAKYA